MKFLKYSFIFLFISVYNTHAQYLWQIYNDKIIHWNYYDGDEFNKDTVDTKLWYKGFPWGRATIGQDSYLLDSNIVLNDGLIQFVVKKQEMIMPFYPWELDSVVFKKGRIKVIDGNKYQFKYSAGLLWSKKQYQYGYYELKFKAPEGRGTWPAFWLYGGNPNYEIDFFELKGEKENEIHVDVHCPKGCSDFKSGPLGYRKGWGHWIKCAPKLQDGYNIISGEWNPDNIKWYLNGELIAYSNQQINIPMNLTFGHGLAKDGGPFKPGPDETTPFPNYLTVDYVRVYKQDTLPKYKEIYKNLGDGNFYAGVNDKDFLSKKSSAKLKNSRNKKIKETVITISVTQTTKNSLVFRTLGLSVSDNVAVVFRDENNILIKSLILNIDSEMSVEFSKTKLIKMQLMVNDKKINENIRIQ